MLTRKDNTDNPSMSYFQYPSQEVKYDDIVSIMLITTTIT